MTQEQTFAEAKHNYWCFYNGTSE